MKKLKKLALWLMMLVLVFSLSACGETEDEDSKSDRKDRVEERDDEDEDTEDKEDDKSKEDEDDSEDVEVVAEPEEVDAEYLIEKLIEASVGSVMTQTTNTMEMEMSMSMDGVTIDMDMSSVGTNLIQMNPYMAYTTTEMTMNVLGEQQVEVSEGYVVTEDGNLVSYTYSDSTGIWSKMDTGMTEEELMEQQEMGFNWLKEKPVSDFTVDAQLHNINGRDAYKVEFTLTGEEMNQSLNGMAGVKDMLDESGMGDLLDMSSLNVPAVYYIDAETYRIIQMEMDMEGLDEMMNNMISSLLGADAATAGYEMDIRIGKCHVFYSDISYDPVEIPALPAEATETTNVLDIENIEVNPESTEIRESAGTYVIEESGYSVMIECPQGWTVTDTAYDTLSIENEETWQMADFVMYIDVTRDDFVAYVEDMIVPEVESYGITVTYGAGTQMGAFETMEVLCEGINFYFAWAPVGEGWVMVTVTEYEGKSLEEVLPAILDMVIMDNVL